MVYGLEREGRFVYCSSFVAVSELLAMGWIMSDSGRWVGADGWVPRPTRDPSEHSGERPS